MAITHRLSGDTDWNSSVIEIRHDTPDKLLVSIGDTSDTKSVLISTSDFIDLARAVGIVAGQKLPSKPVKP